MSQPIYTTITARILALLDAGTVPWQRPWSVTTGAPRNLLSQQPYHGINVWLLGSAGYAAPFWATFHQVKAAGGSIKKGEHGTPVVFWKTYDKVVPERDTPEKRFVLRSYTVFNAAQCDGIAVPTLDQPIHPFTPIERCTKLVGDYPAPPTILHSRDRACYRPSTDTVLMPDPTLFAVPEEYYSTLFHELTHSTGHPTRLNRATLADAVRFGDVSYAKEELVAEMGAAYLCGVCGIANTTVTNSAAYLAGWKKALKNDPTCVVMAASQAEKAANYIQGITSSAATATA
jgi:antirestriction protein ArdC